MEKNIITNDVKIKEEKEECEYCEHCGKELSKSNQVCECRYDIEVEFD